MRQTNVHFVDHSPKGEVEVWMGGKLFTRLIYPDSLEKYVLYPLYSASGKDITRGYPISPREGEKTDHPHHIGLWFAFGDVEGIDFWNNSSSIPEEKKCRYGTIRLSRIVEMNEAKGTLSLEADWKDCHENILLKEKTTFSFSEDGSERSIIRNTDLIAYDRDISLRGNKEGLLGLRLTRELEDSMTGVYENEQGDKGAEVWGKRSPWVSLSGIKEDTPLSITIFDHPDNPFYPAWSHARGYGLFAVNNLGGKVFNAQDEEVSLVVRKGESITFKYKILINDEESK